MKVKLSGAQGTRILGTADRTDHRVREKKTIQPSGPQPESSNNPLFSGWACKPYLYIYIYRVQMLQLFAVETGQISSVETGQISVVPESSAESSGLPSACGASQVAPAGV